MSSAAASAAPGASAEQPAPSADQPAPSAVCAVALALGLLCALGAAGAVGIGSAAGAPSAPVPTDAAPTDAGGLQDEREVDVDASLANDSGGEAPVVTTDAGTITVVANATTSAAVDPGLVQHDWDYTGAVDPSRVAVADGGQRLTYDLRAAEAGETLGFQVTAAGPGDESDTDVVAVDVRDPDPGANAPDAVLTYFDDPETDAVEREAADGAIEFSAFQSSDPNQNASELTYEWQVSQDAAGEVAGLSELSGNDYDADFFARYDVAETDAGESFAVRLVVTNARGLTDADAMTVRVHDDGSGYSTVERGGARRVPRAEPEFDVAFADAPETVPAGEDVDVALRVENVGEVGGTAALGLALAGSDPAVQGVPLAVGESRTLNVSFTAPPAPGEFQLTTLTQDAQRHHAFEVRQSDGAAGAPDGDDAGGPDASDDNDDAGASQGAGTGADAGDDGLSALGWAGLLGVVFALSVVGVGVRRVAG